MSDQDNPSTAALFAAIQNGELQALEAAAAQGADLNAYDADDNTPLIAALRAQQNGLALRLLALGADVNKTTDRNHYSAFCYADAALIPQLKAAGGDPNFVSSAGPALAVVLRSHTEDLEPRVRALIAAGADLADPQVLLQALRGDAARQKALPLPVLQALLAAGMPVDRVNDGGHEPHWISPLELALSEPYRAPLFQPLLQAGAPLNVVGVLQALVRQPFGEYGRYAEQALRAGLSPDSRHFPSSDTALHIAAQRNDEAWLELLLAHGASLDVPNGRLETPLGAAVRAGALRAAQCLLEAGANADARLDHSTLFDWSRDHRPMQRLLAKAGAKSERAPKRPSKLDKLWDGCHEAEGPEQQVSAFAAFLQAAEIEPAWLDADGALARARASQDARWSLLELTEALLPSRTLLIDRDKDALGTDFYADLVQQLAGAGGPPVARLSQQLDERGAVQLHFEAQGQAQQWRLNPVEEGFDSGFWYEADALLKSYDKNLRYWRMDYDAIELVCCVPKKLAQLWEADPIR